MLKGKKFDAFTLLAIWLLQSLEHPPSAIALCLAKKVESFARYGSKV